MTDRFSDRFINGLTAEPREYVRRDPANQGFAIRVHPTGRKTWLFFYDYRKRRRKMTLGSYPDMSLKEARLRYEEARVERSKGHDPAFMKQAEIVELNNTPTVGDLSKMYLEAYARRRKLSWREDERALKKDVLPRWEHRLVTEIRRRDVAHLLDTIAGRGAPFAANGVQVVLSSMFNYAVEME